VYVKGLEKDLSLSKNFASSGLASLFVDNADPVGVNHWLHQVLYFRNPVSGPSETYHLLIADHAI